MTDINHGERQLIPQGLQIGQYLLAALSVERGERLIEQQEPRLREQGAADGDALFFASGQLMNAARHERLQVEHADYAIESDMAGACRASFCKFEVSADVQMWKQPGVLKDISDTSFLDRYVDTQFAVEEDGVIEHHAPADGPNSATTPGVGDSNLTSRLNAPRCLVAATVSINAPASGALGAQTIRTPTGRPNPVSPIERRAGPRHALRRALARPSTAPTAVCESRPGCST